MLEECTAVISFVTWNATIALQVRLDEFDHQTMKNHLKKVFSADYVRLEPVPIGDR